MDHEDARLLAGAVADREAAPTRDLTEHLASCADCAAYAAALDRLSVLTAALPREPAPASLAGRVTRGIRRRRWRRRLLVSAPAVVAATAALVVLSVLPVRVPTPGPGPGVTLVALPPAEAAEPLLRLRSLYVERTVTAGSVVTRERIWWRAPASVRVERSTGGEPFRLVTLSTPGTTYDGETLTERAAPTIPLPEPLSPTVALLGRDRGPGPVVAGLPTRTYQLTFRGHTRTAHVADGVWLGATEALLLYKGGENAVKTTQVVRVDADIPDSLFAPPSARAVDGGFGVRELADLAVAPQRGPEGFAVVRAGTGPDGDAALFARGSLPLLVRSGGLRGGPGEVRSVPHGGRTYVAYVDLYEPPAVQVTTARGTVTVSAPLPVASLVALAAGMYAPE